MMQLPIGDPVHLEELFAVLGRTLLDSGDFTPQGRFVHEQAGEDFYEQVISWGRHLGWSFDPLTY